MDATKLPTTNAWLTYSLPATQAAQANHLIIHPSWSTLVSATFGYFVSYREAVGGDSGLQLSYRQT